MEGIAVSGCSCNRRDSQGRDDEKLPVGAHPVHPGDSRGCHRDGDGG